MTNWAFDGSLESSNSKAKLILKSPKCPFPTSETEFTAVMFQDGLRRPKQPLFIKKVVVFVEKGREKAGSFFSDIVKEYHSCKRMT